MTTQTTAQNPNTSGSKLSSEETKTIVNRVSFVGIAGNIILSAFKLFAGIIGHSGAMVSDAVHSLSDVFATFIALIGVRLSQHGADKEHPYGHERLECVASLILGGILLITGAGIGISGMEKIFSGNISGLEVPGAIALAAAIVSIVVKEAMFWYTRWYALKINSSAFMADAWHHRSDAFSSIGSLIGIVGARLGFPILDPIASVIICIFILKVAIDIFRDAIRKMTDSSCDDQFEEQMRRFILAQDGVLGIDLLRTRMFGTKVYADVEIAADGNRTLNEVHDVAEHVHNGLEEHFPDLKHVMVHVNPYQKET